MPDPSRKRRQPTRYPSRARSAVLIPGRLRWLCRLPWGSVGMPRCPASPGSKGRADRPARQPKGQAWAVRAGLAGARTPRGVLPSRPAPQQPPTHPGSQGREQRGRHRRLSCAGQAGDRLTPRRCQRADVSVLPPPRRSSWAAADPAAFQWAGGGHRQRPGRRPRRDPQPGGVGRTCRAGPTRAWGRGTGPARLLR